MTATMTMNAAGLRAKHESGLSYDDYLATDPEKAARWNEIYEQAGLTDPQRQLLGGFTRAMRVLCVSGIWCGDCVQQGPLLARIAEASNAIDLRWVDRDEYSDLADAVMINGGKRVPVVLFMAEDYAPVSIMGDRTLSRYRAMATRQLGPACPRPGAPVDDAELSRQLAEWLDEFERVQLLLRLSGRLRERHGD